jgi:hypothetical protein
MLRRAAHRARISGDEFEGELARIAGEPAFEQRVEFDRRGRVRGAGLALEGLGQFEPGARRDRRRGSLERGGRPCHRLLGVTEAGGPNRGIRHARVQRLQSRGQGAGQRERLGQIGLGDGGALLDQLEVGVDAGEGTLVDERIGESAERGGEGLYHVVERGVVVEGGVGGRGGRGGGTGVVERAGRRVESREQRPHGRRSSGGIECRSVVGDRCGVVVEGGDRGTGGSAPRLQRPSVEQGSVLHVGGGEEHVGGRRGLLALGVTGFEAGEGPFEPDLVGVLGLLVEVEQSHGLRDVLGQHVVGVRELRLQVFATLVERDLDLLEPLGAEQGSQHGLAVVVLREQELLEAVLGQQHYLEELVFGEGDDVGEFVRHIDGLRGENLAAAAEARLVRLFRGAGPVLLRAQVLGHPAHRVVGAAHGELQLDVGGIVVGAVVAAQLRLRAVVARHAAVQGEADRVEDARLARPGLAGDEEEAGVVEVREVDDLLVLVRAEAGEGESADSHDLASSAACSATTSAMSADSKSDGPTPLRTSSRKPATISVSDFFAMRSR